MCPWARCDNTAKAIFEQMMLAKARFRPEEFSHFIQLLIFSKASWDDDEKVNILKRIQSNAVPAITKLQQFNVELAEGAKNE